MPRGQFCNNIDWLRKCLADDNNNNNKNVSDGNTNDSVVVADLKSNT